ncbi:MAG: outer membrane beta-barrel protein [Bacteroidales bacterium]|nr:outer membrane beta-barrel protein [Bacteroidales bacterium]
MKRIIALVLITICYNSFAQQPCRFCDTLPPYKHSITVQVNRAFPHAKDWGTFILDKGYSTYNKENYSQAFFSDIRYGYRILSFLSIGPEFIYENEYIPLTYSEQNENLKIDDRIIRTKAGAYTRIHGNWLQVFKPYADIGLGYFYMHQTWTPKNQKRTDLFRDNKLHKFDFYVGAGMSFMIWKNHFNIDLGAKYSPILWSNIFSKKVVFTWKLGYNFNCKNTSN